MYPNTPPRNPPNGGRAPPPARAPPTPSRGRPAPVPGGNARSNQPQRYAEPPLVNNSYPPSPGYRSPPQESSSGFGYESTTSYGNTSSPSYNNYSPSTSPPSFNSSPPSRGPTQPSALSTGERTWSEKFGDYFVNDGPKIVFVFLWAAGNIAFFTWMFYTWYAGPKKDACIQLGLGRPFARGAAECLKFNSALMALTVARNFLSWIRGGFLGNVIPVDKNIIFHRYIGYAIALFTLVHVMSWWFNYNNLSKLDPDTLVNDCGLTEVRNLGRNPHPYELAYLQLPGATGHLLILVMVLMFSSAIKYIRQPMFNLFWYTHHLFILYWALLIIHGRFVTVSGTTSYPTFILYFSFPGFVYLVERTIRLLRGSQDTMLLQAIAHPSKVLELQMKKSSFKYKPGQYLFLNCPYVAGAEWHPFTISSAPEEDFISVHMRIVGDWTGSMWNLLNSEKKLGVVQENLTSAPDGSPILRIDGPFGTASEEVFQFRTVVLCAGGIGVTPFGSILKSIRYRLARSRQTVIQKVYFYWISRDKNSFEWFNEILAALENENINNFLEIFTYLTGTLSLEEIQSVMYSDDDADQITGLQSPTYFGRPDWKTIFGNLAKKHAGEEVGVFYCGPPVLSKQLYSMCRCFTDTKTKTRFRYHKENF